MTSSTSEDNSVLLIHAYLDGELDPANALEIAQRMSTDPALAAEGRRVTALQQLIHERLPREVAPPGLRARIEASVGGQRRVRERPSWRALAASIALTAVVASSSTWLLTRKMHRLGRISPKVLIFRAIKVTIQINTVFAEPHRTMVAGWGAHHLSPARPFQL